MRHNHDPEDAHDSDNGALARRPLVYRAHHYDDEREQSAFCQHCLQRGLRNEADRLVEIEGEQVPLCDRCADEREAAEAEAALNGNLASGEELAPDTGPLPPDEPAARAAYVAHRAVCQTCNDEAHCGVGARLLMRWAGAALEAAADVRTS